MIGNLGDVVVQKDGDELWRVDAVHNAVHVVLSLLHFQYIFTDWILDLMSQRR